MTLRLWGSRFRKLWSLDALALRELVLAQLELVLAQLRVWTRPRGRLIRAEAQRGTAAPPSTGSLAEAQRLSLAVQRAGEHGIFRPSCLVRSVALQRMLGRRGHQGSRICIGVLSSKDGFLAHSWVEYGDLVLGDQPFHVQRFEPFGSVDVVQG
jgi:hypothetical protein